MRANFHFIYSSFKAISVYNAKHMYNDSFKVWGLGFRVRVRVSVLNSKIEREFSDK